MAKNKSSSSATSNGRCRSAFLRALIDQPRCLWIDDIVTPNTYERHLLFGKCVQTSHVVGANQHSHLIWAFEGNPVMRLDVRGDSIRSHDFISLRILNGSYDTSFLASLPPALLGRSDPDKQQISSEH
ncbi:unnamed protein product [Fusarium graminearum]|nr:unnamed protein product [Fusarium graminearum]